jgi:hypothetical protein
MNILFIGDIFASGGRGIVAENLNRLITEYKIDLAIANAENSAGGFGITPLIAEDLRAAITASTSAKYTITTSISRACCVPPTIRKGCPAPVYSPPRQEMACPTPSLICRGARTWRTSTVPFAKRMRCWAR